MSHVDCMGIDKNLKESRGERELAGKFVGGREREKVGEEIGKGEG